MCLYVIESIIFFFNLFSGSCKRKPDVVARDDFLGAIPPHLKTRYSLNNTRVGSLARPGAFAANFTPEVLNRFRDLCKQQGRQYTKVLQLLAEIYIETDGAVLDGRISVAPVDPEKKKRQIQVESLQNKLLEDLLKRVEVLEKKDIKMLYELDRVFKEIAFMKSGLQSPE